MYLSQDPMRDGWKIRTPSINWHHEWRRVSSKSHEWCQLIRGVQIFHPSRIKGPEIDIPALANFANTVSFLGAQKLNCAAILGMDISYANWQQHCSEKGIFFCKQFLACIFLTPIGNNIAVKKESFLQTQYSSVHIKANLSHRVTFEFGGLSKCE